MLASHAVARGCSRLALSRHRRFLVVADSKSPHFEFGETTKTFLRPCYAKWYVFVEAIVFSEKMHVEDCVEKQRIARRLFPSKRRHFDSVCRPLVAHFGPSVIDRHTCNFYGVLRRTVANAKKLDAFPAHLLRWYDWVPPRVVVLPNVDRFCPVW